MHRSKAFRRRQAELRIQKRFKLLKNLQGMSSYVLKKAERLNELSKHHPLDCGKADCQLCHFSKVNKLSSLKDKVDEARLKAELEEENEHSSE